MMMIGIWQSRQRDKIFVFRQLDLIPFMLAMNIEMTANIEKRNKGKPPITALEAKIL